MNSFKLAARKQAQTQAQQIAQARAQAKAQAQAQLTTNGGTNMKINSVSFSHDSTYLYANFKFTTNISGTGFKPHYNIEVIDPNQCTYTCVAF